MDAPDNDGPGAPIRTPSSRPTYRRSTRSLRSTRSHRSGKASEVTPLLARENRRNAEEEEQTPATSLLLRTLSNGSTPSGKASFWKKRRLSIIALVLLVIAVVALMLGFLATESLQEYAVQAADFKPTKLSLDSLTNHGVKVLVEGDFTMDTSRVDKNILRSLGRIGTWIAKEVESGPTTVHVYLPDHGNVLVGTAKLPGIKVGIRNGHTTHISSFAILKPGSFDGIRDIANDWIEGRLDQIRLRGKAEIPLRSGLIRLGKQTVEESMLFQRHDVPSLPRYNITRLNVREARPGHKGMGADVSILVTNDFPVQLIVPPVAVDVLVPGCPASNRYIPVGTAETARLDVQPKFDVEVNVTGRVEKLPTSLIEVCPDSAKSPLDALLGDYLQGQPANVYVKCCTFPDPETPSWAGDLLKDISVKVPVVGHGMGNMIKDFSLADVHFQLPEPFADPDSVEASPKISAVVTVGIDLPGEMNFPLDVNRVKADADIFYHEKLLGKFELKKWQKANSTRVDAHGDQGPSLLVRSDIEEAPIKILDNDVFSEVVQALMFGSKLVTMQVKAAVSVKVDTPIGEFAVREMPAEGAIPVKPIGKGNDYENIGSLAPKMDKLSIVDTSTTSLTFEAHVNITNPTNYSVTIPYFNVNILFNGTVLSQAVARDIFVHPGNNTNLLMTMVWDPFSRSGDKGKERGREFLSQYISGYNTSLTIQAHNGTIPSQPAFGALLSHFPITVSAPRLATPRNPDEDGGDDGGEDGGESEAERSRFIRGATMHLISSTAVLTLASPFTSNTLYLTRLDATAFYDGHPTGKILYDDPFAIPPGLSETPRLPVDWSLSSMGYEAIRKALGGQLKLSTFAHVGVRIGHWREQIWYRAESIGANVRL